MLFKKMMQITSDSDQITISFASKKELTQEQIEALEKNGPIGTVNMKVFYHVLTGTIIKIEATDEDQK